MSETPVTLKAFEIKVDGGAFHLKTHGNNETYYLCTWFIRNFSSFQSACSNGFKLLDGFRHSVTLSVNKDVVKVIIDCRGTACRYKLNYAVTFSTVVGGVFVHKIGHSAVCCTSRLETISVTGEELQKLEQLPNDTLILTCRMTRSRIDNIVPGDFFCNNSGYLKSLEADLKTHSIGGFSNEVVNLQVGEETETINKAILCARSPVFAMMFQSDMKEHQENTVTIADIKMPVLKVVIAFLSSGVIPECDVDFLCDLYYAANKYNIVELHHFCIAMLLGKMSVENILQVLEMALLHTDEVLKCLVLALICANMEIIELTSDWKNLVRVNPRVASMVSTFFHF